MSAIDKCSRDSSTATNLFNNIQVSKWVIPSSIQTFVTVWCSASCKKFIMTLHFFNLFPRWNGCPLVVFQVSNFKFSRYNIALCNIIPTKNNIDILTISFPLMAWWIAGEFEKRCIYGVLRIPPPLVILMTINASILHIFRLLHIQCMYERSIYVCAKFDWKMSNK